MRASLEIRVHAYSLTPKTNNTLGVEKWATDSDIVVRKKHREIAYVRVILNLFSVSFVGNFKVYVYHANEKLGDELRETANSDFRLKRQDRGK